MELNELEITESQLPVIYRAVGWVAGTYQPSAEKFEHGVLITEDGQTIPTELHWRLRNYLNRKHSLYNPNSGWFKEPHRWTVYPQTDPLRFQLVVIKPLHSPSSGEAEKDSDSGSRRPLDHFRMVGEIESVAGGTVNIRICRNEKPPSWKSDYSSYQPFVLTVSGSLPLEAVGQIWDLEVRRSGSRLVVAAGRPYVPSPEDLAWHKKHKQQKAHSQRIKPSNHASSATVALSTSSTPQPPPSPGKNPDATLSDANADTTLTSGQMEVVVKLNQFPDDVQTVDNGWKEFVVDTGSGLVTITVKPKVFAVLEQAHQAYPSWVAAISGQMGEMTLTGFRLESPAIKVFERKAKDSSLPEPTRTSDNPSPSLATESKPEPTVPTLPQQQATQPKPESPQQPVPTKNPTQRVKEQILQQRPTKTPPHPGQKQQPHKPDPSQKQLNPSTPLTSPQSQKPRFTVKVNDQVFSGFDSVTLHKRVVRVDGKPVGQAKMVIVLGQPLSMQADGGVSQGRNQAVLTSR